MMTRARLLYWVLVVLLSVGGGLEVHAQSDHAADSIKQSVRNHKLPFERRIFTQGLEIADGQLWVSSGGYGRSFIARYQFPAMTLDHSVDLPRTLFAEGLTLINDEVWVLTWRARRLLRFDRESLRYLGGADIPGEGWGLTHHENTIWLSDGSSRLLVSATTLPFDWQVLDVTEGGQPLGRLNELEWVDGEIWANVWQSDRVVRIDPESGQILGDINLEGLLPRSERRADTDVLNGIARDPETGTVWVTGKRWPWLYPLSFDE